MFVAASSTTMILRTPFRQPFLSWSERRVPRRGLAVSGGTLAAALGQNAASACVPTAAMSSTIKAVTLIAAGNAVTGSVTSAKVAALAEGVVKAMFLNKLMKATVAFLVV